MGESFILLFVSRSSGRRSSRNRGVSARVRTRPGQNAYISVLCMKHGKFFFYY